MNDRSFVVTSHALRHTCSLLISFAVILGPNAKPSTDMGRGRDWNVDLIPKFLMANGSLVKVCNLYLCDLLLP